MWRVGLLWALAGCGADEHTLPPPPTDAASSCVTTAVNGGNEAIGTLWLDDRHQVFRIDGILAYDDGIGPAAFFMEYDDAGRLTSLRTPLEEIEYAYEADAIRVTTSHGYHSVYTLSGGRLVRYEGGIDLPDDERFVAEYTYDADGHLTERSGRAFHDTGHGRTPTPFSVRYSYDAQGRVTSLVTGLGTRTVSYTDSPTGVVARTSRSRPFEEEPVEDGDMTYELDASQRVVRSTANFGNTGVYRRDVTYRYGPGIIEANSTGEDPYTATASGDCAPPTMRFAPEPELPLRARPNTATIPNHALELFDSLSDL